MGLLGDPLGEARAALRAKLRGSGVPTEASWTLPPFGGAVTIYRSDQRECKGVGDVTSCLISGMTGAACAAAGRSYIDQMDASD